jgi:hypothetical protein
MADQTQAVTDAAVLASQGTRDADILQAAGIREASSAQAGGTRDAEALAAAGAREAAALRTEGQRGISLIQETTQMRIAILTVVGFMSAQLGVVAVIMVLILRGEPSSVVLAVLGGVLGTLSSMMTLVIGFYFGRTNHSAVTGALVTRGVS